MKSGSLFKLWKIVIISVTIGLIVTGITGLLPNPPEASIPEASYYGFPKNWLIRRPLANGTNFVLMNFFIDFLFFSFLTGVAMFVLQLFRRK